MLVHLTIKNYALIRSLEMRPSENLNIITGETGAGKSIMIGAVGLLLGNRADVKTLYDENVKCVIEGAFNIKEYKLSPFFEANDLDYQEVTLIRREISPQGKSRAFVNDTPVTLDVLKELGSYLMDIHSQHDTLLLASNDYQLSLIDAFAGNQEVLDAYKKAYQEFKKTEKAYYDLKKEAEKIGKEADYNQFLYEELSRASLRPGEQEELEDELKALEHTEEIKANLSKSIALLNHSERSVISGLYETAALLKQLGGYSEKFRILSERMEASLIEVKDIAAEVEREESLAEYDPEKAEAAKERLSLIYHLQQKHRVATVDELLAILADLEAKTARSVNLGEEIEALRAQMEKARETMLQLAKDLSATRTNSIGQFTAALESHLRELGMPNAVVTIARREVDPSPTGIDELKMMFSANKGMPPQELKNVASGGEFSRLMFCVKFTLADKTALPTVVFDEVDAGISGEIAIKMALMMEQMAKNHQALVITHLPQIAARGSKHYFVFKDDANHKTVSSIRELSKEERVIEIAKMLSGEKPSAMAMETAKELLGY